MGWRGTIVTPGTGGVYRELLSREPDVLSDRMPFRPRYDERSGR